MAIYLATITYFVSKIAPLIDVQLLDDSLLPEVFAIEPGEAEYEPWLELVTAPDWLRYGLFKDEEFAGYIGIQKVNPVTASLHISIKPHTLRPSQTRKVMIQTGICLFNDGIERLETVHPMSNKPACRLANACHMPLDYLRITNHTPFCCHYLMKQSYLANPANWETK